MATRRPDVAATGEPDTVAGMPSRFTLKSMNAIHKTLLAVSFGRIGWNAGNMPVLKLTTVGRKSGAKREVMLTSPLQIGDTWVIVASKGGDDDHPAWYLNLLAEPRVEVDIRGTRSVRTARVANADERASMWPKITATYTGYAGYQNRTSREIPLILLEPAN
jgi:deazaflavin-dependent oxidoreductase (nitroreductase family)